MRDLERKLESGTRLSSRDVVVTFDDGFKNNLTYAAPIADRYSIRPTLFISTEHIDSGRQFPTHIVRCGIWHLEARDIYLESIEHRYSLTSEFSRKLAIQEIIQRLKRAPIDLAQRITKEIESLLPASRWRDLNSTYSSENVLNWEEVEELAESGWEIGSHCKSHIILNEGSNKEVVRTEIRDSKARIETVLGCCNYFSYPNGEIGYLSKQARIEAERSGYKLAFTAQAGDLQGVLDRWSLPRRLAPRSVKHLIFVLQSSMRYRGQHRRWVESLIPKE